MFKVEEQDQGMRLDKFLVTKFHEESRSRLQGLIEGGHVRVNQLIIKEASYKVKEGQEVDVTIPPLVEALPSPQQIPLDILYEDLQTCDAFFREEYTLNTRIHEYKKPYISLIDGIAMGGGLGISINGSHRIVTEKALLAMPETGIGFFPDVGATTFLTQAPGSVGLYLGLTGTRLKAEDALWTGLATHFMPPTNLQDFKHALEEGASLEEGISTYCTQPQEKGFLEHHATQIDSYFHKSSLEEVMETLSRDPAPFAQNTLHTLRSKSPTSLAVVFRQLQQVGPPLSFRERMKLEFRLSQHFVQGHDFAEGVRAVLVDKDHLPRWKPTTLEEINPQEIGTYFSSLGSSELNL